MKKLYYVIMLAMALAISGCANEGPPMPVNVDESAPTNPYRVTVNDAVQIANSMLADIGDVKTRSSRQVEEVSVIRGKISTRSSQEENDTVLYIINYANNEGFAIVSADKRAIPVYALSDTGSFQITEDSNPAIEAMLSYAVESAKYNIQVAGFGPLPFEPIDPPGDSIKWYDTEPHKKIAPMLSKRQNRMGPYDKALSKYVVNDTGEPALTCCAAIATELIMSYYAWPEKLVTYTFDWTSMNSGNDDDGIARLLGIISGRDYLHVYGNDSTHIGAANLSDIRPTFEKCGYEKPDEFINFYANEQKAIDDLENGPLFLYGASGTAEYSTGHVWAVDGLLQYYRGDGTVTDESGIPIHNVKLYTYYHCVWGDSGTCNGYYLVADHDFNGAPDIIDAIDSGDVSSAIYRNYSKDIRFMSNFKPVGRTITPPFPPIPYQPQ